MKQNEINKALAEALGIPMQHLERCQIREEDKPRRAVVVHTLPHPPYTSRLKFMPLPQGFA